MNKEAARIFTIFLQTDPWNLAKIYFLWKTAVPSVCPSEDIHRVSNLFTVAQNCALVRT